MEIKSLANIKYSYDLDGISLQSLASSNVVTTEVRKFNLLLKKLSNQDYFKLDDIITYTLLISNTGNYKNTNILIKDNLLNQQFIDCSIRTFTLSNEKVISSYSLENNYLLININEILPNEVVIITYKVKIISNDTINSETSIKSNETSLAEIKDLTLKQGFAKIECTKTVSDDVTFLNTDLTYLLHLTNVGNISAYNVEIFDELPITFELDQYNPVTLNNSLVNYQLENNILKILIPSIEPNSNIEIKVNGKIIN